MVGTYGGYQSLLDPVSNWARFPNEVDDPDLYQAGLYHPTASGASPVGGVWVSTAGAVLALPSWTFGYPLLVGTYGGYQSLLEPESN